MKELTHIAISDSMVDSFFTDALVDAIAENCPILEFLDTTQLSVDEPHTFTDQSICKLASKCPNLTSLLLGECKNISDLSLVAIGHCCKNFQELYVINCTDIKDVGIFSLANNCPKLKVLVVKGCSVSDVGLQAVATNSRQLVLLDVDRCDYITDLSVLKIVENCPELTQLHVRLTGVTDAVYTAFAAKSTCLCLYDNELQMNCLSKNLRKGFERTDLCITTFPISMPALLQTVLLCPGLLQLRLKGCNTITDADLKSILSATAFLEVIELIKCAQLTREAVAYITSRKFKLKYFGVADLLLSDEILTAFCTEQPSIAEIVIQSCGVHDNGIEAIANHCQQLKSFTLKRNAVSNDAVKLVIKQCTLLRKVTFHCEQLTADVLTCIAEHSTSIVDVNVNKCARIRIADVMVMMMKRSFDQVVGPNGELAENNW